jgi:hypothetical protein
MRHHPEVLVIVYQIRDKGIADLHNVRFFGLVDQFLQC